MLFPVAHYTASTTGPPGHTSSEILCAAVTPWPVHLDKLLHILHPPLVPTGDRFLGGPGIAVSTQPYLGIHFPLALLLQPFDRACDIVSQNSRIRLRGSAFRAEGYATVYVPFCCGHRHLFLHLATLFISPVSSHIQIVLGYRVTDLTYLPQTAPALLLTTVYAGRKMKQLGARRFPATVRGEQCSAHFAGCQPEVHDIKVVEVACDVCCDGAFTQCAHERAGLGG